MFLTTEPSVQLFRILNLKVMKVYLSGEMRPISHPYSSFCFGFLLLLVLSGFLLLLFCLGLVCKGIQHLYKKKVIFLFVV